MHNKSTQTDNTNMYDMFHISNRFRGIKFVVEPNLNETPTQHADSDKKKAENKDKIPTKPVLPVVETEKALQEKEEEFQKKIHTKNKEPYTEFCSSFMPIFSSKSAKGPKYEKRTKPTSYNYLKDDENTRVGLPKYQLNDMPMPKERLTIIPKNAVRTFECAYCGQEFSRNNSRKRHEKLHTDQKKFKCFSCNKQFSRKDILTRHFNSKVCKRTQPPTTQ